MAPRIQELVICNPLSQLSKTPTLCNRSSELYGMCGVSDYKEQSTFATFVDNFCPEALIDLKLKSLLMRGGPIGVEFNPSRDGFELTSDNSFLFSIHQGRVTSSFDGDEEGIRL